MAGGPEILQERRRCEMNGSDEALCWAVLCCAVWDCTVPRCTALYLRYSACLLACLLAVLGWQAAQMRGHEIDVWSTRN